MKYQVEQNITINKSVEEVAPLLADFNNWNKWSPWTKIDPESKIGINGAMNEAGYSMSWDGELVGSGVQTLIKTEGGVYDYDLSFIKPFKSKAKVSFRLESVGEGTKVTWTMDSKMPIFLFFMVKSMKNWLGLDFDRGLRMMKAVAEKGEIGSTTTNQGVVDAEGFGYVGIKRTVDMKDLAPVMSKDFETLIAEVISKRNLSAKHWLCLYPKMNMNTMQMTYIAAVSDENLQGIDMGEGFVRGQVEAGKALEIKHEGSYEFLGNAWSMGMMAFRAKKMKKRGMPYEYYWNSPKEVTPEELKTSIYFPVK